MVGRRGAGGNGGQELHVNVPSFFRCPISLDVMRSPVSLSTGVTYDRSSIQAWLDTGHNTCPATMQVLPSTDFVPNHTLHRLIQLWSAHSLHHPLSPHQQQLINADTLLRGLPSSADPLPALRKLAEVAAGDAARVRELADNAATLPALWGVLLRRRVTDPPETTEAAVRVLAAVLRHRKEDVAKADALSADFRVLPPLVGVLKLGTLESRIAAAWVVEAMAAAGAEAKRQIAEAEGMLTELLRLVEDGEQEKPAEPRAIVAGLAALAVLSSLRRVRPRIVAIGSVPALARLLARPSTPLAAVESALQLMEAASTCTEGRAAICADPAAVTAVVGRMTRVPSQAAERAVAVAGGGGGGRGRRPGQGAAGDADQLLPRSAADGGRPAQDPEGELQGRTTQLRFQDHPHRPLLIRSKQPGAPLSGFFTIAIARRKQQQQ